MTPDMRERWGIFSVRDHMTAAPFVTEVLLYDRLVVPVPPSDAPQEPFWSEYDPDLQERCLEVLKTKTDTTEGLALKVPWDSEKRARFSSQMSTAAAIAEQQRQPDQPYYVDPFAMTRQLINDEFRPALPNGVSKAWMLPAFSSVNDYRKVLAENDAQMDQRRLSAQIAQRFLTPSKPDPKQELLKRAVDLSMTDKFRLSRAKLFDWQKSVFEDELSDAKAIAELESRVLVYNKMVEKSFKDVYYRFAYTVIPIALGLTGSVASGNVPAIVLAGAASLVQIARFAKFDRVPKLDDGGLDGASMIHDAQQLLLSEG